MAINTCVFEVDSSGTIGTDDELQLRGAASDFISATGWG